MKVIFSNVEASAQYIWLFYDQRQIKAQTIFRAWKLDIDLAVGNAIAANILFGPSSAEIPFTIV
jgi:hypothetical protein